MPPRAFATQRVQIGQETSPGVAVPAQYELQAIRITPKPMLEGERFAPSGHTAPTLNIPLTEMTEADVEGRVTYTDADFIFGGAINKPVKSVPTGAPTVPTSVQRVYTFDGVTPADPAIYTVEYGDNTLARRFAHGMFQGLSLSIARDALDFSSAMIGQRIETGQPLTAAGVTTIEPVPIAAGQWSVYVDDTFGALGTTKFLEAYEATLELGERYAPTWPINAALPSFASYVENGPDDQEHTGQLTVGASASMESYLGTIRQGAKKFVRLEAVGPTIEGTITHRCRIDMCIFPTGTPGYEDLNGLLVLPFEYQLGRDGSWDRSLEVTLINTIP